MNFKKDTQVKKAHPKYKNIDKQFEWIRVLNIKKEDLVCNI